METDTGINLLTVGALLLTALILAGIAPASAPAAVTSVVEGLRAKRPFSDTLLGIVAIDDAWGPIVFSMLLALAMVLRGHESWSAALATGGWELTGPFLTRLAVIRSGEAGSEEGDSQ